MRPTGARDHSRRSAHVLLAIAAAAAAVLAPLIVIGFDPRLFSREATVAAARTQLWLVMVAVEAASWTLIVAWIGGLIGRLHRMTAAPITVILTQAALPVVILALPAVLLTYAGRASSQVPPTTIGLYSIRNMPLVGATGVLVAMLCVFAMYWARFTLREHTATGDLGSRIQALIELHTHIRACLLCASVTLGLGTLVGATLRNAANAAAGKDVFPAEYVVAYGVTNSVFLAVAYLPVQWQFLKIGHELSQEYAGAPGVTAESTLAWFQRTAQAQAMLGTGWLELGGVTTALFALGPAILGLISHLLSIR